MSARSSDSLEGSGTAPLTGTTCAGVVPQETIGLSAAQSTSISRSNARARRRVRSSRHSSTALEILDARSPQIQSKVVSSGAIMPARPPPSMVMLQIVMRPSIESASIAGPAYSTAWPAAPPVPIWPIVPRIMSLAVTPGARLAGVEDAHRLRLGLGERLGGQHVLDLGRADPERQRAERAVGGGVASRRRRSSCPAG